MMSIIKVHIVITLIFIMTGVPQVIASPDTTAVSLDSLKNYPSLSQNSGYSMNLTHVIFRAFVSLIFIIVLIYLTIFVLKRFWYTGKKKHRINNAITVLGVIPIMPKKSLHFIKIINHILVVGITENNMSLLSEIKDEKTLSEIESVFHVSDTVQIPFKNYLNKMLGKNDTK